MSLRPLHSDVKKILITDYYKNCTITICTVAYIADPLVVGKGVLQGGRLIVGKEGLQRGRLIAGKGVLQGGRLSILLFNMIINNLMKTINE